MKKHLVFNNHCAGWMMTQNFILQDISKRNKGNTDLNVYVFNETEDFLNKLNEYKRLLKG